MNQLSDPAQRVSSAQRCEPGSFPLRLANLPAVDESSLGGIDPHKEVTKWVANFNEAVKTNPGIADLFLTESYWRDHLCLTWEFHTLHGPEKIVALLEEAKECRIKEMTIDTSK